MYLTITNGVRVNYNSIKLKLIHCKVIWFLAWLSLLVFAYRLLCISFCCPAERSRVKSYNKEQNNVQEGNFNDIGRSEINHTIHRQSY